MTQPGVWSFRTATGTARVVGGRLRRRHSLRGVLIGTYRRLGSGSILQRLAVVGGSLSAAGPIQDVVAAVIADGPVAGAVSAGLAAMLITAGTVVMVTTLLWSVFGRSESVDIYDMTDVSVDADDCELTIQYADGGDSETTTVRAADEAALGEAVAVLSLKGALVDEAVVEKWA